MFPVTPNKNWDIFIASRQFVEAKMLALMHIQGKGYARTGVPFVNYDFLHLEDRTLFIVKNNVFQYVMDDALLRARQMFPLNFGTGNAVTVLHALQKANPVYTSLKREIAFLKNENFALCCEFKDGVFNERILRLDLFRKLDPIANARRKFEFTGGVFHAMKHFSYNNLPLTIGKEVNNVHRPMAIVYSLAQSFFMNEMYHDNQHNSHVSFIDYSQNNFLQCNFYLEERSNVFFLKTLLPFCKKRLNKWIAKNSLP